MDSAPAKAEAKKWDMIEKAVQNGKKGIADHRDAILELDGVTQDTLSDYDYILAQVNAKTADASGAWGVWETSINGVTEQLSENFRVGFLLNDE